VVSLPFTARIAEHVLKRAQRLFALLGHGMDQRSRSAVAFLAIFMLNQALTTVWCTFCRRHPPSMQLSAFSSALPKVLRTHQFFNILTCELSSRHSPVHFANHFPRSSRKPAETYFHPESHFTPKNAEFRARACFHP